MKVGFTGTRQGMSAAQCRQLQTVLYALRGVLEFHHGGAVGSDRQAAQLAATLGFVTEHPAKGDPLGRNRAIVASVDLLIAAPESDTEVLRSGTWATVRYARQAGKPVVMLSRGEGG